MANIIVIAMGLSNQQVIVLRTNLMITIRVVIVKMPMANLTVIAMGAILHLVIVTQVTNVMIGDKRVIGMLKVKIPMANLAVIAMGVDHHVVIEPRLPT